MVSASATRALVSFGKRKSLKRFSYRSARSGSMCSRSEVGAASGRHVERVTHRLPHTFQPTQRANSGQHVRRIGALLASRASSSHVPETAPPSDQRADARLHGRAGDLEIRKAARSQNRYRSVPGLTHTSSQSLTGRTPVTGGKSSGIDEASL